MTSAYLHQERIESVHFKAPPNVRDTSLPTSKRVHNSAETGQPVQAADQRGERSHRRVSSFTDESHRHWATLFRLLRKRACERTSRPRSYLPLSPPIIPAPGRHFLAKVMAITLS